MSDYQTPRKEDEAEKSLDEEDDLNDRENAEEFYTLMKEKGHCFGTCKGKLLWYDPANGVYDEESDELKLKLLNLCATSPVVARKYRGSNSKKSALYKEFKSLLPQENSFYEKSRENTKGLFAFNNCIWDFGEQKCRDFSPDYCFTFKAPVDYKKHGKLSETEVRQTVFQSIFGEGEKGEFVAKLLARALAGDVEDKRFVYFASNSSCENLEVILSLVVCFLFHGIVQFSLANIWVSKHINEKLLIDFVLHLLVAFQFQFYGSFESKKILG